MKKPIHKVVTDIDNAAQMVGAVIDLMGTHIVVERFDAKAGKRASFARGGGRAEGGKAAERIL